MSITMIDWIIESIAKVTRSIFHWCWRVQTQRKHNAKKKKK